MTTTLIQQLALIAAGCAYREDMTVDPDMLAASMEDNGLMVVPVAPSDADVEAMARAVCRSIAPPQMTDDRFEQRWMSESNADFRKEFSVGIRAWRDKEIGDDTKANRERAERLNLRGYISRRDTFRLSGWQNVRPVGSGRANGADPICEAV